MEEVLENTRVEKYESYQDSGINWFGKVPNHWNIERLGSILSPLSIKNHPKEQLLSITREKGVIVRDVENEDENHNFIPDDLSNYKLLDIGQFGMNKMKAWQGSYGVSKYRGIVSPAYYVFKFTKDIDSQFFNWAIRSKQYVSFFGQASDGVRIGQWDLSRDRMKKIPFVIPPIIEQTRIATFLDKKTAQIDQAIAQKEQLIELLKERRQIMIHKAVTQGIDPYVKMKDSGVEWIGKIPEHWKIKKLKYCTDILPGYAFKSEKYSSNDSDHRLLRGVNVNPNSISWSETVYWPKEKVHGFEKYELVVDDLVLGLDRPWVSNGIRVATIREHDIPSLLLQRVARIRGSSSVSTRFIFMILASKSFLNYFEPMLTGISVPHISTDQVGNYGTGIPPIKEQLMICDFVEETSLHFEKLISKELRLIDSLIEYKSTLINSAVTGKIKV
ncbi:MAG: restriction endonuclease subunit S [Bacteroidota bacterium]